MSETFSAETKARMLQMLRTGSQCETSAELAAVILDHLNNRWSDARKSTTLADLNRRYGQLAKKFDGLLSIIESMVQTDTVGVYHSKHGATVIVPTTIIKEIIELGGGETGIETVVNSYKG